MQFKLEPVTLKEVDLLTEFAKRTYVETFEKDNTPENMADYVSKTFNREAQTKELTDPKRKIYFAYTNTSDAPVGFLHLYMGIPESCIRGEKPIELLRIYVDKNWHGKGVAQFLMQASLDISKELGYRTIWLGVWEKNHRAQAFYKKWNFTHSGNHIFQMGDDAQTDYVWERSID